MAKRKTTDTKRAMTRDNKIVQPNVYLETDKQHKDWYNVGDMGKQRGKPQAVPKEIKKPAGIKKHSLRKEK